MIYVILLEPVVAGNIGAVARAMLNFGFHRLVLINPHCDHLGAEARNRAKHAQKILEDAEVCEYFIVDDYDYLIATTAKIGTDYNLARSPLTPEELATKVKQIDPEKKIGIVMGRENVGLFNEEIDRCDFTVTIPSDKDKPTLNLSHATAIILYELHKALAASDVRSHIKPIGKQEKDQVYRLFSEVFDTLHWETAEKRDTQEKLWKRVLGKAMLTNREAYSVMGFLRKVLMKSGGVIEDAKKIAPSVTDTQRVSAVESGTPTHRSNTKKHSEQKRGMAKGSSLKQRPTKKRGSTGNFRQSSQPAGKKPANKTGRKPSRKPVDKSPKKIPAQGSLKNPAKKPLKSAPVKKPGKRVARAKK